MTMPGFTSVSPAPCKRGFTLIELLVVISIIALLIAILLPALSSARKAAQATVCLSRLKSFALFDVYYQNDYDNHAVPNDAYTFPGLPGVRLTWATLLVQGEYVPAQVANTHYVTYSTPDNYFLCPGVDYNPSSSIAEVWKQAHVSFGARALNYQTSAWFGFGNQSFGTETTGHYSPKRVDLVADFTRQVITGEVKGASGDRMGFIIGEGSNAANRLIAPHPGGDDDTDYLGTTNMAFLDGHAGSMGPLSGINARYAAGEFQYKP